MATTLKTKNSVTTTSAPGTLAQGELAVNITDKKLWVGNAATTPVQLLGAGSTNSFGAVTVTSLTDTGLTSGRVTYATTGGLLTDNSLFVFDGTNLGIGTSSPASKLNVVGRTILNSTSDQYSLALGYSNSASAYYYIGASANTSPDLVFTSGSVVERMRLTDSGNLGIGTSSPATKLHVVGTTTAANTAGSTQLQLTDTTNSRSIFFNNNNGDLDIFNFGPAKILTLTSSGNIGLGVTPSAWGASYKMQQAGNGASFGGRSNTNQQALMAANWYTDGSGNKYIGTGAATQYQQDAGVHYWFTAPSGTAGNAITFTQAMTLDASGNLLVGTTSAAAKNYTSQSANAVGLGVESSASSYTSTAFQTGVYGTAAGTGFNHITCLNSGAQTVFQVLGNGNTQNFNNSYGAVSDAKLKENIVDATPKLANLMNVKVRNYNLIGETNKQIGVVAQELEQVFPSMVEESPDRDAEGHILETTTKSVKYSVFVPILIKALQEQQALINDLTTRLTLLESK